MSLFNFRLAVGPWDALIIAAYFLLVIGLGFFAGRVRRRNAGKGAHYFLADNTLGWPVIGLAMFAANISAVHLVIFAEVAYKYGLLYGNFEWMAGFTLILLSLFFAPLYIRSRVTTLPDYLERRYNRKCRDILSYYSLASAILLHIGVTLYVASLVLCGIIGLGPHSEILGINARMFFIIALGAVTGVYTGAGGLLAVVWTESVQTVILIVGAVFITLIGLWDVGGWNAFTATLATQPHPAFGSAPDIPASTTGFLTLLRARGAPGGIPWYSIILGYPVIGIWYWCCDQTIVQRVLAARDEHQARLGPLFCAILKILPVLFFVMPGVICLAAVQQHRFGGAAPATPGDAYTFMLTHFLPVGIKGLVIAAMLSAAMQTCSAALNSSATLFAYDVFKRHRPQSTEAQLVTAGRTATVVATILAIVLSPIFGHYRSIVEALNSLICCIAPPFTTVFLVGVFWRKASGRAAYLTLVVGGLLGVGIAVADYKGWYGWYNRHDFMLTSVAQAIVCLIVMTVGSLLWPEPLKAEARALVWSNWKEPLQGAPRGSWLTDYRTLAAATALVFIGLYWFFR